jgi:hypothetical protein
MSNTYIDRDTVHAWSDEIGEQAPVHQSALTRLLKLQRRLTRFVEENHESMAPPTAGVSVYLFGVLARMFDLAPGRLKNATWEQIRAAEARIGGVVGDLLPPDDGFAERVRKVEWRAQPHMLDEALMALFDAPKATDEEVEIDTEEAVKVFLLMWVATEVLESCWNPSKGFEGETSYTYKHIEPTPPSE